jgi:hypothetical protein
MTAKLGAVLADPDDLTEGVAAGDVAEVLGTIAAGLVGGLPDGRGISLLRQLGLLAAGWPQ